MIEVAFIWNVWKSFFYQWTQPAWMSDGEPDHTSRATQMVKGNFEASYI